MPQYIRAFVPGGTFFFTVTLLERRLKLLTEHLDDFRAVFKAALRRRPLTVEAMVILPDHLHCIWTLPSGDADFSTRWHDIRCKRRDALCFPALRPCGPLNRWHRLSSLCQSSRLILHSLERLCHQPIPTFYVLGVNQRLMNDCLETSMTI